MNKAKHFFTRIGLPADTPIEFNKDFLGRLQTGCILNIAYENLDILAGKPVSLEFDDLYDKIVTGNRGGYCFELNGFLIHILREMGFTVGDRFARFLRNEPAIPMRRHRIAVVSLPDGDYMCDIATLDGPNYKIFHGEELVHLEEHISEGRLQTLFREVFKLQI